MHVNFCFLFILHKQAFGCRIRFTANIAASGNSYAGINGTNYRNTTAGNNR